MGNCKSIPEPKYVKPIDIYLEEMDSNIELWDSLMEEKKEEYKNDVYNFELKKDYDVIIFIVNNFMREFDNFIGLYLTHEYDYYKFMSLYERYNNINKTLKMPLREIYVKNMKRYSQN